MGRPIPVAAAPAQQSTPAARAFRPSRNRGQSFVSSPKDLTLVSTKPSPNDRLGPRPNFLVVESSGSPDSPDLPSTQSRTRLQEPQRKRLLESSNNSSEVVKRRRLSDTDAAPSPPTRFSGPLAEPTRTIAFADVYQNGDPEHKHFIIKFPPSEEPAGFYILKCEAHGVHFGLSPIQGGAKHLHSQAHNYMPKHHQLAVEKLGYLVTGCTQKLADKNNKMVKEAHYAGYQPLNRKKLTRTNTAPNDQARLFVAKFRGVSRPEAGQLYYAESSSAENPGRTQKYPVMILNWASQDSCGFKGETLASLGLMDANSPPHCYVFDSARKSIVRWAEGYEDGGPYENLRQFPVAWFADPQFFSYSWVEARWLSVFNLDDSSNQDDRDNLRQKARDHFAQTRGFATFRQLREEKSIEDLRPMTSPVKQKRRYSVGSDTSSLSDVDEQYLESLELLTPPPKQRPAPVTTSKDPPARFEDRTPASRHSIHAERSEPGPRAPAIAEASARSASLPLPPGLRSAPPLSGAGADSGASPRPTATGLQAVLHRTESGNSPKDTGLVITDEIVEVSADRPVADIAQTNYAPAPRDSVRNAQASTHSGNPALGPAQQQQTSALDADSRSSKRPVVPPVPAIPVAPAATAAPVVSRESNGTPQPPPQARAGPLARLQTEASPKPGHFQAEAAILGHGSLSAITPAPASSTSSPRVTPGGFGGQPRTFDLIAFSDGQQTWERGANGELLKLAITKADDGLAVAQSVAGSPADVAIYPSRVVRLGTISSNGDKTESSLVVGLDDREMRLTFGVSKFLRSEVQARSLYKWVMQNLGYEESVAFGAESDGNRPKR